MKEKFERVALAVLCLSKVFNAVRLRNVVCVLRNGIDYELQGCKWPFGQSNPYATACDMNEIQYTADSGCTEWESVLF